MSRLGGPEIKLPDVKVPGFLSDLFYDLKDRHLLPLIAVLGVAIVAVPIVLSESSEEPPIAALSSEGLAALSTSGDGIVVANAAPGLRDYKQRLSDLQATDPFKQHFKASPPESESSQPAPTEGGAEVTGGETTEPVTITEDGGASPGGDDTTTTVVRTETKFASYEIDARIVTVGDSPEASKTVVRRNLPELTMLPGRSTPAIVFMGVSADTKKAMMLVSSDVQSVFGDALCVIGSETCQLLAMEPGFPETFVYGGEGRTYRIEVLKIERIVSKHPERAKLGAPQGGSTAPAGRPTQPR